MEERRERFRIKDTIQLSLVKLSSQEVIPQCYQVAYFPFESKNICSHLETVKDPELFNLLLTISQKLDFLIQHLVFEKNQFQGLKTYKVDININAIKIEDPQARDNYNVGDKVELKLVIPTMPPAYLVCYGEVIRVSLPEKEPPAVVIKFINMPDAIKTIINKYILQRQREFLIQNR